jgi:hypothetical protein
VVIRESQLNLCGPTGGIFHDKHTEETVLRPRTQQRHAFVRQRANLV